jgi:hypothetical protein
MTATAASPYYRQVLGPTPLGLPYARIAAVDGRSDDIIALPAAGGGRVVVHPFRLRAPFAALPDVRHTHG